MEITSFLVTRDKLDYRVLQEVCNYELCKSATSLGVEDSVKIIELDSCFVYGFELQVCTLADIVSILGLDNLFVVETSGSVHTDVYKFYNGRIEEFVVDISWYDLGVCLYEGGTVPEEILVEFKALFESVLGFSYLEVSKLREAFLVKRR